MKQSEVLAAVTRYYEEGKDRDRANHEVLREVLHKIEISIRNTQTAHLHVLKTAVLSHGKILPQGPPYTGPYTIPADEFNATPNF